VLSINVANIVEIGQTVDTYTRYHKSKNKLGLWGLQREWNIFEKFGFSVRSQIQIDR